jgi:hypothetical protein
MKWIWSVGLIAAACAVLQAQDMKSPKMAETTKVTYTGCLVDVNAGGEFVLTHAEAEMADTMPRGRDTLALTSLKVVARSCS